MKNLLKTKTMLLICAIALIAVASCSKSKKEPILTVEDYVSMHQKDVSTHLTDSVYLNLSNAAVYSITQNLLRANPGIQLTKEDIVEEYLKHNNMYNRIIQSFNNNNIQTIKSKITQNADSISIDTGSISSSRGGN